MLSLPNITTILSESFISTSLELPPLRSAFVDQPVVPDIPNSLSPRIGGGVLVQKGFVETPVECFIHMGFDYSDIAGRDVTVFSVHIPGVTRFCSCIFLPEELQSGGK